MVAAAEAKQPFAGLSSIAEIQDWIRKEAARVPAGTWIWSPRIFPTRVREHRFPTRAELDAAAPDHPVAIDGAYAWMVNSAALRAANITAATPILPAARSSRTRPVSPRACSATSAICSRAFRRRRRHGAARHARSRPRGLRRAGITSVIERGATTGRAGAPTRRCGTREAAATLTRQRPRACAPRSPSAFRSQPMRRPPSSWVRELPFKPGEGDDWLAARQLKIVVDGGILAGTAYMRSRTASTRARSTASTIPPIAASSR